MNLSLPATEDRSYLTDGRPYLNPRQAATFVGYEPTLIGTRRTDPQMRCFYAWAKSRGVAQLPGRNVYRRSDLEQGMLRRVPDVKLGEMEALARRLAGGQRAPHLLREAQ